MIAVEELRFHLRDCYRRLSEPGARIRLPRPHRLAPGPSEGHFHLRAELFLQCRAATRFRFPGETLDLGPGEVLVVPSRVYHAETVVTGSTEFLNVVLYADEGHLSCHLADKGPLGTPRIAYPERLSGPECTSVASWLEDAVRVSRTMEASEVAVDLIRSILGMTLQLLDSPSARGPGEPLVIVRCRQMIHEALGDPTLSVASLAQRLGCNPDYLSHLFRAVRQEKLTSYIEELRMLRAAELLSETNLSCKEVGWASGYGNQSYFIRCFRRRWGCSPGEFLPLGASRTVENQG
jgi:AraC-like DNA-binding protein